MFYVKLCERKIQRIFLCFPNWRRCYNEVVEEENKQPVSGTEMGNAEVDTSRLHVYHVEDYFLSRPSPRSYVNYTFTRYIYMR